MEEYGSSFDLSTSSSVSVAGARKQEICTTGQSVYQISATFASLKPITKRSDKTILSTMASQQHNLSTSSPCFFSECSCTCRSEEALLEDKSQYPRWRREERSARKFYCLHVCLVLFYTILFSVAVKKYKSCSATCDAILPYRKLSFRHCEIGILAYGMQKLQSKVSTTSRTRCLSLGVYSSVNRVTSLISLGTTYWKVRSDPAHPRFSFTEVEER